MWIKNLTVFVGSEPFSWSSAEFNTLLADNRCPPCGSQTQRTEGFVPPLNGHEQMVYAVNGFLLCHHKEIIRLLPGPVIRELLDEKVELIQNEEGRKVGRKEKADLKEQITFELMPRAFTRSRRTAVLIDTVRKRVMVDSSAAGRAEDIVAALRRVLGTLPVAYPVANNAPYNSFSSWLKDPTLLPEGFSLGDRCELKSTRDEGSTVRFTALDLGQEEILAHLDKDMAAVRMNLCWRDALEWDVNDKLEIKRIKPLDMLQENISTLESDDAVSELEALISLQGPLLREALDSLYEYFEANPG